jgi:CSLREA domain-containing protein
MTLTTTTNKVGGATRRFALLVALAFALALAFASPAHAATITVNSTADKVVEDDGLCTLREAINAASNDTSAGTIAGECAAGSGADTINIGVTGTVNLTGVLPNLASNLQIEGPGADRFTVRRGDATGHYRVFTVTGGSVVSISGITI